MKPYPFSCCLPLRLCVVDELGRPSRDTFFRDYWLGSPSIKALIGRPSLLTRKIHPTRCKSSMIVLFAPTRQCTSNELLLFTSQIIHSALSNNQLLNSHSFLSFSIFTYFSSFFSMILTIQQVSGFCNLILMRFVTWLLETAFVD